MGNLGEKNPVSQKFYVQVGDPPGHAISLVPSNCYATLGAIFPDTSVNAFKNTYAQAGLR
jgi:hypothetical protein